MKQGDQEWHDHRANHLNASEAGAVMGVNPWQPRNQAELFDVKIGAMTIKENDAMRHGTESEPLARAEFVRQTGREVSPIVVTRGQYSASLDGQDLDGSVQVEIKCPMRSNSKALRVKTAKDVRDNIPHYWWQMVHQLYVSCAEWTGFFVWHPRVESNLVWIHADELIADRDALLENWESFAAYLDAGERPGDGKAEDESSDMQLLEHNYLLAKAALQEAQQAEKDAKNALIEHAQAQGVDKLKGADVTVQRSERKGAVDYSKIPELEGVNLDYYRKQSSSVWSVK